MKLNLEPTLKVDAEDFENKEHLEIMEKEKGIKMEPDADSLKTKMALSVKRKMVCTKIIKAPLYTKLTLMDCGIGNTNLLGFSSSGLGYGYFYMK